MSRCRNFKGAKPRSSLQRLQSLANWNIHFILHPLPYNNLAGFILTEDLIKAYSDHSKATRVLQEEIGKSYQLTKMHILRKRKEREQLS